MITTIMLCRGCLTLTREEALKKLEKEWPQEKDIWEFQLSQGEDPVEVLGLLESFA